MNLPYILIAVVAGLLIVIMLMFLLFKIRKYPQKAEPDYRVFFIIGIIYLPLGLALNFFTSNNGYFGLIGIGAIFLAVGLANRDKWKKHQNNP
jgi:Na+/melibiose symporter-like transporter